MEPLLKGWRYSPVNVYWVENRREVDPYIFEVAIGVASSAGADEASWRLVGFANVAGEIGLSRRLAEGRLSPYIGVGMLARAGGSAELAPWGQVGVDFAPRPSMRLFLELRAAQHLLRTTAVRTDWGPNVMYAERYEQSRPAELGAQIGVAF
jgi:hypothetical protein